MVLLVKIKFTFSKSKLLFIETNRFDVRFIKIFKGIYEEQKKRQ